MFNKLKEGKAPSRRDVEAFSDFGIDLHAQTLGLVHDPVALERAFGGNGEDQFSHNETGRIPADARKVSEISSPTRLSSVALQLHAWVDYYLALTKV